MIGSLALTFLQIILSLNLLRSHLRLLRLTICLYQENNGCLGFDLNALDFCLHRGILYGNFSLWLVITCGNLCLSGDGCTFLFQCLSFLIGHQFCGLDLSCSHYFWFFFQKICLKTYGSLWYLDSQRLNKHVSLFEHIGLSFHWNSQYFLHLDFRHYYFNL